MSTTGMDNSTAIVTSTGGTDSSTLSTSGGTSDATTTDIITMSTTGMDTSTTIVTSTGSADSSTLSTSGGTADATTTDIITMSTTGMDTSTTIVTSTGSTDSPTLSTSSDTSGTTTTDVTTVSTASTETSAVSTSSESTTDSLPTVTIGTTQENPSTASTNVLSLSTDSATATEKNVYTTSSSPTTVYYSTTMVIANTSDMITTTESVDNNQTSTSTAPLDIDSLIEIRFVTEKNVTDQEIADSFLQAIINVTSRSTRKRRSATASDSGYLVTIVDSEVSGNARSVNCTVAKDGETLNATEFLSTHREINKYLETALFTRGINISALGLRAAAGAVTSCSMVVTIINDTSIRIEFGNSLEYDIDCTSRHQSATRIPILTASNSHLISELVADTLYDIVARTSNSSTSISKCTAVAHTYPSPIKVVIGEDPLPDSALLFVGSNPRVTQWEFEIEESGSTYWNWTTSGEDERFAFVADNLTANTEYRIRTRPSQFFGEQINGSTEFGDWANFTTGKLSVFGKVTWNVTFRSFDANEIAELKESLINAYDRNFSDLSVLKTENHTVTGDTIVHYEIKVNETSLPVDTNFTLEESKNFSDSQINNGVGANGSLFWTVVHTSGNEEHNFEYDPSPNDVECSDGRAIEGVHVYTSESGNSTYESFKSVSDLGLTDLNCQRSFSLSQMQDDNTRFSDNMTSNSVYIIGIDILKQVLLEKPGDEILYTRFRQGLRQLSSTAVRKHYFFSKHITRDSLHLSELNYTANDDSAIVSVVNVPKSVRYEIISSSHTAVLEDSDIDGSDRLQIQLDNLSPNTTYDFNLIVTALTREGLQVIASDNFTITTSSSTTVVTTSDSSTMSSTEATVSSEITESSTIVVTSNTDTGSSTQSPSGDTSAATTTATITVSTTGMDTSTTIVASTGGTDSSTLSTSSGTADTTTTDTISMSTTEMDTSTTIVASTGGTDSSTLSTSSGTADATTTDTISMSTTEMDTSTTFATSTGSTDSPTVSTSSGTADATTTGIITISTTGMDTSTTIVTLTGSTDSSTLSTSSEISTTTGVTVFPWYLILIIILGVLLIILLVVLFCLHCGKRKTAVRAEKKPVQSQDWTEPSPLQDPVKPDEPDAAIPEFIGDRPPTVSMHQPHYSIPAEDSSPLDVTMPSLRLAPPSVALAEETFMPRFTHTIHPITLLPPRSVIRRNVGDSLTDDAMMRQRKHIERQKNKSRLRKKKRPAYDPYIGSSEIDQILAPPTPAVLRRFRPPHKRRTVDLNKVEDPEISMMRGGRHDPPGRYTSDPDSTSSSDSRDSPETTRRQIQSLLDDAFPLVAPSVPRNVVAPPHPRPMPQPRQYLPPVGRMHHPDGRTADFPFINEPNSTENQPQTPNIFQIPSISGPTTAGQPIGYPPSYNYITSGPPRSYHPNALAPPSMIPTYPFIPGTIPPPPIAFGSTNVSQPTREAPDADRLYIEDELARLAATSK